MKPAVLDIFKFKNIMGILLHIYVSNCNDLPIINILIINILTFFRSETPLFDYHFSPVRPTINREYITLALIAPKLVILPNDIFKDIKNPFYRSPLEMNFDHLTEP